MMIQESTLLLKDHCSPSSSLTKRIRFILLCCTGTLLLLLFSYLHYFGDYSNTVIYFVVPSANDDSNAQNNFQEGRANNLVIGNDLVNSEFANESRNLLDYDIDDDKLSSRLTSLSQKDNTNKLTPGELLRATPKPRQCFIPKLMVDDPSLKHLMKHYSPLKCSQMKNWIYTKNGKFYIDRDAIKNYAPVTCDYINIERIDEYKHREVTYTNYKNGSNLFGDAFRVVCRQDKGANRVTYKNVHVGVPNVKKSDRISSTMNNNTSDSLLQSHVMIYLLDSMSRINFIRKLPKFYKTLTETLDASVMEGFNVVGDGTPWAVIPMTTGHFQTELPEARKRFANATYIDDWPFIFKDYRNNGYATSYVEEQPAFSAFTYKLKGFNRPPVDHYLRTMLMVADKRKGENKNYCLGDTPKSLVWLKYWKELRNMYDRYNKLTFSFLFSSETSHDDYNLVQVLDDHLSSEFDSLHRGNYLNNTFVFVMGDHGRRFGPVRQTQSGKLEEKLPFLAVITPPWFKESFPKSYKNLKTNTDRLVTVFDLHATLKNILDFRSDGGMGDEKKREISLFHEIPDWRTCENAHIKPHFCSCLKWNDVQYADNDTIVQNATQLVINNFNQLINRTNGLCAEISLNRIISARTLAPSEELMAFKESQDYDNYFPDLTGNKSLSSFIYQIRFTTNPANADWEVSVNYFVEFNRFIFSESDVSRLNMYGDQPKCIIDSFHHLRQYCYCVVQ